MPATMRKSVWQLQKSNIQELLSPVSWKDGKLVCEIMALGDRDSSERVGSPKTVTLDADNVITAVGEQIDNSLYKMV